MSELLVSVRSPAEAEAALAGGAALIDVKEPAAGPLGRADDATIAAVVRAVAGRCPVSAALGELGEDDGSIPRAGLAYVKWGLAGWERSDGWRQRLMSALRASSSPQVVLTAYADWQCARAPAPEAVFALAAEHPGSVLLLDTCCKDASSGLGRRPTLLDWLPSAAVMELCQRCRDQGVRIALAGSLGAAEITALRPAAPNWFAVRGAACVDGERGATIATERVAALARLCAASLGP